MKGRIVIAGGGLIGLGIAWKAAARGFEVTVVDEAPGSGASYAAAGMLAPVSEASYGEEPLLRLAAASLERYPQFAADLEAQTACGPLLRATGTLQVGFDADDMRALGRLHDFQLRLGLDARMLAARECRRLESLISPRIRGGVHAADESSVDPRHLHAALMTAALGAGVQVRRERITALEQAGDRVCGVRLADGSILGADQVVLALGAHSPTLGGVPTGSLPVRPVKGQILRLRGERLLQGTVRALVRGRSVYLVPHGEDRLVVGASVEEQGFDGRVTAGAVRELLNDAAEVVPGIDELQLVETLARWRPGTPDNAPLIGATSLPGLIVATGHYRNGVLLTPITADVVLELLCTGALPSVAAPFSPLRFAGETESLSTRNPVEAAWT